MSYTISLGRSAARDAAAYHLESTGGSLLNTLFNLDIDNPSHEGLNNFALVTPPSLMALATLGLWGGMWLLHGSLRFTISGKAIAQSLDLVSHFATAWFSDENPGDFNWGEHTHLISVTGLAAAAFTVFVLGGIKVLSEIFMTMRSLSAMCDYLRVLINSLGNFLFKENNNTNLDATTSFWDLRVLGAITTLLLGIVITLCNFALLLTINNRAMKAASQWINIVGNSLFGTESLANLDVENPLYLLSLTGALAVGINIFLLVIKIASYFTVNQKVLLAADYYLLSLNSILENALFGKAKELGTKPEMTHAEMLGRLVLSFALTGGITLACALLISAWRIMKFITINEQSMIASSQILSHYYNQWFGDKKESALTVQHQMNLLSITGLFTLFGVIGMGFISLLSYFFVTKNALKVACHYLGKLLTPLLNIVFNENEKNTHTLDVSPWHLPLAFAFALPITLTIGVILLAAYIPAFLVFNGKAAASTGHLVSQFWNFLFNNDKEDFSFNKLSAHNLSPLFIGLTLAGGIASGLTWAVVRLTYDNEIHKAASNFLSAIVTVLFSNAQPNKDKSVNYLRLLSVTGLISVLVIAPLILFVKLAELAFIPMMTQNAMSRI